MSFGGLDNPTETSEDSIYHSPSGHGVTWVAATGDDGAYVGPPGNPSISPNVLGVGGTSLYAPGGVYQSEIGWEGSGGGISAYESQPSYQSGLVIHDGANVISAGGMRTNPERLLRRRSLHRPGHL